MTYEDQTGTEQQCRHFFQQSERRCAAEGSGIAFQKKAGQEVDPQRVEKTFLLKDKDAQNRFTELMIDVPMAHILVSEKIINYAKIKLGRPL